MTKPRNFCFIESCPGKKGDHCFRVPVGMLEAWQSLIPKQGLTQSSLLCHRHFKESDINKCYEFLGVPYKRWRLKSGSMPSLNLDMTETALVSSSSASDKENQKAKILKKKKRKDSHIVTQADQSIGEKCVDSSLPHLQTEKQKGANHQPYALSGYTSQLPLNITPCASLETREPTEYVFREHDYFQITSQSCSSTRSFIEHSKNVSNNNNNNNVVPSSFEEIARENVEIIEKSTSEVFIIEETVDNCIHIPESSISEELSSTHCSSHNSTLFSSNLSEATKEQHGTEIHASGKTPSKNRCTEPHSKKPTLLTGDFDGLNLFASFKTALTQNITLPDGWNWLFDEKSCELICASFEILTSAMNVKSLKFSMRKTMQAAFNGKFLEALMPAEINSFKDAASFLTTFHNGYRCQGVDNPDFFPLLVESKVTGAHIDCSVVRSDECHQLILKGKSCAHCCIIRGQLSSKAVREKTKASKSRDWKEAFKTLKKQLGAMERKRLAAKQKRRKLNLEHKKLGKKYARLMDCKNNATRNYRNLNRQHKRLLKKCAKLLNTPEQTEKN